MTELTLADHCCAFWADRGIERPILGTPRGDEMYRLWAEWAFSNMNGKKSRAQDDAMRNIEKFELNMKKEI